MITLQKSSCPNHSTPPTIATIFADFVLDNPAAVSEDEAAPREVEDLTAPGDVQVEDPSEDGEDEFPTDAEDEAAPGEVEDATALGDVEAEEKRGGRMSRGRGGRTRRFVSPTKKTANQQPYKRTIRREGPTYK